MVAVQYLHVYMAPPSSTPPSSVSPGHSNHYIFDCLRGKNIGVADARERERRGEGNMQEMQVVDSLREGNMQEMEGC